MQPTQVKDFTLDEEVLAVALELSKGSWKVALHDGKRDKPAIHTVSSEEAVKRLAQALAVIEEVKRKWKLAKQIRTVSSEEAVKRLAQALAVIEEVKRKWKLAKQIRTVVMYEA